MLYRLFSHTQRIYLILNKRINSRSQKKQNNECGNRTKKKALTTNVLPDVKRQDRISRILIHYKIEILFATSVEIG